MSAELRPPHLPSPPQWTELAECQYTDPEIFYPEEGGSARIRYAAAKKTCRDCGVRAECLEYALANDERYGVWGGLSERERRRLQGQRKEARAA